MGDQTEPAGRSPTLVKFVTFAAQICYLCYPNYTWWMKLVRDVRDCLWKNEVFFFFFYSLVYVFVSSVYHCKRNFPVGVLRLQKDIWRTPSWLNAESVTLDEHTQENIWDVVKDGEQIENKILNGME